MRHTLNLHTEGQTQDLDCFMKQGTTKEDQAVAKEAEVPDILA